VDEQQVLAQLEKVLAAEREIKKRASDIARTNQKQIEQPSNRENYSSCEAS